MKFGIREVLAVVVLLLAQLPAQAAVITVDSVVDSAGIGSGDGECTLREAMHNANLDLDASGGDCAVGSGSDVINFAVTGTILLDGLALPVIGETLTIVGPGFSQLTINANGQSRIFTIDDAAVIVADITLTGGAGGSGLGTETNFMGGAIYAQGAVLTLTDSVLTNNHTMQDNAAGGAVAAVDAELGIFGSLLSNNSTAGGSASGGAVFHDSTLVGGVSALTIRDSRFSNNQTIGIESPGGAVFHAKAEKVDIINSRFTGNHTEGQGGRGGAVNLSGPGIVRIQGSHFEQNHTQGHEGSGGALHAQVANDLSVERSHFINNHTLGAFGLGGAVYCSGGEIDLELQFDDSRFTGNRTQATHAGGGAIYCDGTEAPILINHSLLDDNRTEGGNANGGAVFGIGSLFVQNSRIENNRTQGASAEGGGIYSISGLLTVSDSALTDNLTEGLDAPGGAIAAFSSLHVSHSSFTANRTLDDESPGGAVHVRDNPATIKSSTFAGNETDGSLSGGGALYVDSGLTLVNATLSGNGANNSAGGGLFLAGDTGVASHTSFVSNEADDGGGIFMNGQLMLNNSLLAANSPDNCFVTSAGGFDLPSENNIADDAGCGGGTQQNADIGDNSFLDALADNGGPTSTHALLTGSPAINTAGAAVCGDADVEGVDQRGAERPHTLRMGCDVGAYEAGHQVLETNNHSDNSVNADAGDTDIRVIAFSFDKRDASAVDVLVQQLELRHCLGNTLPSGDIDRLAVWQDGGDGQFDAGSGDDLLIDDDSAGPGPGGTLLYTPPGLVVNLTPNGLITNASSQNRYYVSIDVESNLFALNAVTPGWTQTAFAAGDVAMLTRLPMSLWLAAGLALGMLIVVISRRTGVAKLKVLLLASFTAVVITACSEDDDDDGGGGSSGGDSGVIMPTSVPNPSPTEAHFCLALLSVEARTADADQQIVPVANLPLTGAQVNLEE